MSIDFARLFFLFAFAQFTAAGYGQRQLSLAPALGITFPFSYAIEPAAGDIGFGANTMWLKPSLVLNLQYELSDKWIVFGGWHASSSTSTGLRYGDARIDRRHGGLSTASYTPRFQVGGYRYLTTCRWLRLGKLENALPKNDALLYLVLFKLRLIGGLSHDYIVPFTGENELKSFSSGMFVKQVVDRSSFSAFVGLNLQFFSYKRDLCQLSFLYSQGFTEVIQKNVSYFLPSGSHQAVIGSRGSFFSIQLGYPIKLFETKPRAKRRKKG